MQLTKQDILNKLYDISEKENINVDREVQKTIRNEIVPIEVIKILNRYDKSFIPIYDTYNEIYTKRHKNPLYRNLRNKYLQEEEIAIAMSSLITKMLISYSKMESMEKQAFLVAMQLTEINEAISEYAQGDSANLKEVAKQVRELLELLYVED